jgi:hypothetical protein
MSPDGELTVPHVIISVALEEDQAALNVDSCRLWLSRFPGLVKYAKVHGVFKSDSTLLLLSLPIAIWNMLPGNPACSFISFIMSDNLACKIPALDKNTGPKPVLARSPVKSIQPPIETEPLPHGFMGIEPLLPIQPTTGVMEPRESNKPTGIMTTLYYQDYNRNSEPFSAPPSVSLLR